MRNAVIWAIRDAQGLTANEKVFLFTVESRGVMTSKQTNAAKDMGLSRATYYRVRDGLIEKNLLTVRRNMDAPTEYTVNEVSLSETQVSHTETELSHSETEVSHSDNTKKNRSKKVSKNMKKNSTKAAVVADAPTASLNLEVKEDAYEYLGSLNLEEYEDFSNSRETLDFEYLANSKGVAVFDALSNPSETKPVSHSETVSEARPSSVYTTEAELWERRNRILGRAS